MSFPSIKILVNSGIACSLEAYGLDEEIAELQNDSEFIEAATKDAHAHIKWAKENKRSSLNNCEEGHDNLFELIESRFKDLEF